MADKAEIIGRWIIKKAEKEKSMGRALTTDEEKSMTETATLEGILEALIDMRDILKDYCNG